MDKGLKFLANNYFPERLKKIMLSDLASPERTEEIRLKAKGALCVLKKSGLSQKEAQATALFMMFFLSSVSAGIYLYEGHLSFTDALGYIPGGILGGIADSFCFRKISPALLRKIFGGFVIFSAARMLWGIVAEWI